MKIAIIAAMTPGTNVIGKDGDIPWKLPSDMKRFKLMTNGKAVVMGRKTYESIGKPLPNRTNIVITRNQDFRAPGCIIVSSAIEAVGAAKGSGADELWAIGGERVYREFMQRHANEMHLTFVLGVFNGDTYFPSIDSYSSFKMTECSDPIKNEGDECFHIFCKYEKQNL
jgi:dihydrofolate reductase